MHTKHVHTQLKIIIIYPYLIFKQHISKSSNYNCLLSKDSPQIINTVILNCDYLNTTIQACGLYFSKAITNVLLTVVLSTRVSLTKKYVIVIYIFQFGSPTVLGQACPPSTTK